MSAVIQIFVVFFPKIIIISSNYYFIKMIIKCKRIHITNQASVFVSVDCHICCLTALCHENW